MVKEVVERRFKGFYKTIIHMELSILITKATRKHYNPEGRESNKYIKKKDRKEFLDSKKGVLLDLLLAHFESNSYSLQQGTIKIPGNELRSLFLKPEYESAQKYNMRLNYYLGTVLRGVVREKIEKEEVAYLTGARELGGLIEFLYTFKAELLEYFDECLEAYIKNPYNSCIKHNYVWQPKYIGKKHFCRNCGHRKS